jgi:hypothetical protein
MTYYVADGPPAPFATLTQSFNVFRSYSVILNIFNILMMNEGYCTRFTNRLTVMPQEDQAKYFVSS